MKYPDEYWKIIQGSNEQYKISNYGRVKRIYKNGKEKFLLPFQRKGKGNLFVKARWKEKYGEHKVSHVVAKHFIRPIQPNERVIHKNGIITDDYAGNLQIVSLQEMGKRTGYKSKSKPVVLLDPVTMEVIEEYRSAREAGRKTHFSYQAVLDRCNKRFPYKNDPFLFMFADDYEKYKRINE